MQPATLCYVTNKKTGHTLMLHRVKKQNDVHEGKWNGLGGKFEPGESPEECVIREVKEESGLEITEPIMRGFITFPMFDGKKDWLVFIFTADKFEGELINSAEGNLEWVPNKKLYELNLWESDKIFFPWLEDDKFFSAKFVYENGELKYHTVNFY
ncbi:MAG: 8-oxo-dGTP diphosphatase [Ignavibacteriaceae bacterium]|nr:8-oxo-dGTP diphosphatase [Ignavibacteriaceae bacterium]